MINSWASKLSGRATIISLMMMEWEYQDDFDIIDITLTAAAAQLYVHSEINK